jgi:hypothetical protein
MLFLDVPVDFLGFVVLEPSQRRHVDSRWKRTIAGSAMAVATGEGLCRGHIEIGRFCQVREKNRMEDV